MAITITPETAAQAGCSLAVSVADSGTFTEENASVTWSAHEIAGVFPFPWSTASVDCVMEERSVHTQNGETLSDTTSTIRFNVFVSKGAPYVQRSPTDFSEIWNSIYFIGSVSGHASYVDGDYTYTVAITRRVVSYTARCGWYLPHGPILCNHSGNIICNRDGNPLWY